MTIKMTVGQLRSLVESVVQEMAGEEGGEMHTVEVYGETWEGPLTGDAFEAANIVCVDGECKGEKLSDQDEIVQQDVLQAFNDKVLGKKDVLSDRERRLMRLHGRLPYED